MCGICGKININNREVVDARFIHKMTEVLKHRGPDDEGIYINGNVGIGHRRLSIIDLSKDARQPMSNEDKSIWIVCNGEIYNFQELRKVLEKKGHIFCSRSDTEVIIHLYEELGTDCVEKLRGMFAFCIWDEKRKRLFLARDRIGQKPLNYAIKNGNIIFASEIKSILQDPEISREVDINALDSYLTYQYVPAPETMFSGINKLPPAHSLVWENGKIKIERYWNLNFQNKINMAEDEFCQRILDLLTEATKIRLVSDVPLGVFLSGGIDSSAIVGLMSKLSSHPVKTFSIGFEEETFNELKYARKVAKIFATDHHEYIVKPEALNILPKIIWHFNEPFADSSCIPTYYLSKMTRQEVTVALNGDGGDETFAGYERYVANKIANIYNLIPQSIRKNLFSFITAVLPESTRRKDFIKRFKRFAKANDSSRERRYARWMSIFDDDLKSNLYSEKLKNRLKGIDSWNYLLDVYRQSDANNFIDATLFVDIMTYLPGDLLVKIDISSMANSLETRSPFLDHKLMEFAASIPSNLKLKGWTTKYLLKKALTKILPKDILNRRKAGFGVPIGTWFRQELKDYAYDILLSEKSLKRGYFKKEAIKRILDEHTKGKIDHGARIWSLINFELWHQMFIDNYSLQNGY